MSTTNELILLESGDHLGRDEFHRRYCLRPDIKKAELVQGVVYVASPVRYTLHSRPQRLMLHWLSEYQIRHPKLECGGDATVILDPESEVQPDAFLLLLAPDGVPRLREDGYIEGAPQLVVEIAASSASIDLHAKLRAYEKAGVVEYIVWRTIDDAIDWFRLKDGTFERVQPDDQGVIESSTFPGLRLHVARMLDGDMVDVLDELRGA